MCSTGILDNKAIPANKRVALALWFLATGADYRTVGHLFGVSKSMVYLVMMEVCASIVSQLLPEYMKFPEGSASLSALLMDLKSTMVSLSVLEQSMVAIFQLSPLLSALQTTKDGTQSSCRGQLITESFLRMYMWDVQVH